MRECDLDGVLSAQVKACVADCRLAPEFSARLVAGVRRRKRLRRIKLFILILVVAALGIAWLGLTRAETRRLSAEDRLIAAEGSPHSSQASGWMIFGAIRECFKRTKNIKKKEEE